MRDLLLTYSGGRGGRGGGIFTGIKWRNSQSSVPYTTNVSFFRFLFLSQRPTYDINSVVNAKDRDYLFETGLKY
jgi:hypothetical protein